MAPPGSVGGRCDLADSVVQRAVAAEPVVEADCDSLEKGIAVVDEMGGMPGLGLPGL